jgi:pimeloyl-ACP methyl ester carboxylesterase
MYPAGVPGIRTRRLTLANGLTLRVAEAGDPSAPPVLLLHGWGASLYMWREWFATLAATGRRPIAVDLPGHGLSDKPDDPAAYRLEGLMDAIRQLLDVERPERVDVVAQSMAGTIALELALAGEPRLGRLALVNPACFGLIRLQALARAVSPRVVDAVLPRMVPRWIVARAHRLVYGDPSLITAQDEDEYWAPSQFPSYARAMRRLLHEFRWSRPAAGPMAQRLRALPESALVVLGTRDRLVRDARLYVASLRAEGAPLDVHEVSGGGHAVNEERPREVASVVMEFLSRPGVGDRQHRAT